jgi:hypothetical protein
MTAVENRHDLVEEILKELGVLLKMRIDSHVYKYYKVVPARFLNQFIIDAANMEKIERYENKVLEEAQGNIKHLQLSWHD